MSQKYSKARIIFVATLVVMISLFHYVSYYFQIYSHVFYRELYFFPLILAAFWFGFRGAVITSLSISTLYLPGMLMGWQCFSLDFDKVIEILLFNVVAMVFGFISDRERAKEKALKEVESLAAIGKAISGVAHDLKTPLVAIGGLTRLVQRRLKSDDSNRETLDIVIKETQRLETMVKEMLDFSRPLKLNQAPGDLNKLVGESLTLVEDVAKRMEVKIETKLQDLPQFLFDPMRMKQVLINLITNAIQVSPEDGTVMIRTYREGARIIFDVVDHGSGVPPDIKEKIFTPFLLLKGWDRSWAFNCFKDCPSPWRTFGNKRKSQERGHLQGCVTF